MSDEKWQRVEELKLCIQGLKSFEFVNIIKMLSFLIAMQKKLNVTEKRFYIF